MENEQPGLAVSESVVSAKADCVE